MALSGFDLGVVGGNLVAVLCAEGVYGCPLCFQPQP